MNTPIHDQAEFLKLLCKATGVRFIGPTDRACVITRSPANYGRISAVTVEWEGSPPPLTINYQFGGIPIVNSKRLSGRNWIEAVDLINRFLDAHPNGDGSPVWIGRRYTGVDK